MQPLDVTGKGLGVRLEVVRKQYRLGRLEVGPPRHRGVRVLLRPGHEGLGEVEQAEGDLPGPVP